MHFYPLIYCVGGLVLTYHLVKYSLIYSSEHGRNGVEFSNPAGGALEDLAETLPVDSEQTPETAAPLLHDELYQRYNLSPREQEVLPLLLQGVSNKELSERLFISVNTVKIHLASKLGGVYSYEVLVELPEPDMAKEPEVLRALEEMDRLVHTYETTRLTMSLNTLIKDINMTMHNNDRESFSIPDSRDLIAQYLLLYEMSGGEELDNWVDYDYQILRLSVQISRNSSSLNAGFDEIEAFGKHHFPAGTQVTVTGDVPIMIKSGLALIDGQLRSIVVVLIAISGIMMIVLQSVRVGLLAMIPNILPVAVMTGVMGLFRFPINDFTVLVAPMIIGISVDDTIHYFVHFKQEFQQCRNYRQATRETFRKVGPALIFASVILTVGFATFTFSIINSMVHIAILLAAGTFTALLADLYITPALFVFLKPFGKVERETETLGTFERLNFQQES